ncbi:MAG TPA: hypothetical protein VFB52_14095 [Solirubrobacterales bacterium]|nr:hypothetical protein [Solirubrobacterales bacterium]
MIEPERALRDVRAKLRETVLPQVGSTHGRTILAAALGIIDAVIEQVKLDPAPAEATVAEMLPALVEWERELAVSDSGAADRLASARAQAERAADPFAAREQALAGAELALEAAWADPDPARRERLLASVRRAVRADVERQRRGGKG